MDDFVDEFITTQFTPSIAQNRDNSEQKILVVRTVQPRQDKASWQWEYGHQNY
jgi:hypothetical protein